MDVVTATERTAVRSRPTRPWWLLLVAGIAWVIVSFVILAFTPTSMVTIAYLVAFLLIAAGVTELASLAVIESWRWLRAALGGVLIVSGCLALVEPFQTFGLLAVLIGWYFLVKGTFSVVWSIADREVLPLWGLLLAVGLLELAIGLWAIGYPGRSAWLVVVWTGLGALLRGITGIVDAFRIHRHGRLALA